LGTYPSLSKLQVGEHCLKVLFDHCIPAPYRTRLAGHEVTLASESGWQELSNGKLLSAAEKAGFSALLTVDKGIAHQQNLSERTISVILLSTPDTRIVVLDLLVTDVLRTNRS
jgi:hypothetical protein